MDDVDPKKLESSIDECCRQPGQVTYDVFCDNCDERILGLRYKCSICPNWDHCERCQSEVTHIHPMHIRHSTTISGPTDGLPVTKLGLLTGNIVEIHEAMTSAEIMRRSLTQAWPIQHGYRRVYEYTPLDDERSFRLIALLPSEKLDRIRCTMVHATLDDDLDFEALSYAWGDKKTLQTIHIDALEFYVQQNLYDALHALRLKHVIRYLWIDALCIDQIDDVEKGSQVRNMKTIYTKANSVIFWIGKAADDSDFVIDTLASNNDSPEFWSAAKNLFSRPCWNRVWCLQELSVAKKAPIILCGDKSLDWAILEIFYTRCSQLSKTYPDNIATVNRKVIESTQPYLLIRKNVEDGYVPFTLSRLLLMASRLQATDVRDHVYALVGLERSAATFHIDYTETVNRVFIRVAQHIIASTGRLDVLCEYTNSVDPRFEQPLPSWVSNWTMNQLWRPVSIMAEGLYKASGNHQARVLFEKDHLVALGMLTDRIDRLSGPILFSEDFSNLSQIIKSLEEMVRSYRQEVFNEYGKAISPTMSRETGIKLLKLSPDPRFSDAFWRTLTLNKVWQTGQKIQRGVAPDGFMIAPAEIGNMYEIFRYGNNASRRVRPEDLELSFDYTIPRLQGPISCVPEDFEPSLPLDQRVEQYISPLKHALTFLSRRQFFITEGGRIGLATHGLEKGDLVAVLYGADVPFILRDRTDDETDHSVQLISDAYVHGMMEGEIIEAAEKDPSFRLHKFIIR